MKRHFDPLESGSRSAEGWPMRFSLWLLGISLITGVHAAGIPTVDVGVIAQQIRSYQQQLRDFETQLQQVSLNLSLIHI